MTEPWTHTYAALEGGFFARVKPTPVAKPSLVAFNVALAEQLHLDATALQSAEGVAALAGNCLLEGTDPIALAYAGHQFGGFVPQLGDGRAILLGEVVARDGRRYDVQLKGAGPTPFSRGGDGRAALGPVLREYVVSEAMAALGVPTTRALAAVTTGETVRRDLPLPGAVLTRVASSHLRIGTFQYFAAREAHASLERLTEYALARHYPDAPRTGGAAMALLDSVMGAQARLVAKWMALGFVHGVMNTDNTSIGGETLDYGPCAFLDTYKPDRVFSSIDRGGRYAFSNQPGIALWNLTRLAEALLPLVEDNAERAAARLTERLEEFPARFHGAYEGELRRKLGLSTAKEGDAALAEGLLARMAADGVDYSVAFRTLTEAAASGDDGVFLALFKDAPPVCEWLSAWRARLVAEGTAPESGAALMRQANPAFIPRNHRVEEMIAAATAGDYAPFHRLLRVLARPYDDQPSDADLTLPPGADQWSYRTFCGT